MKKTKIHPKFNNENEEFEFWEKHETTDYFDMSKPLQGVSFPNLKFSPNNMLVSIPQSLAKNIKSIAEKKSLSIEDVVRLLLEQGVKNEIYIFASAKSRS